MESVLNSNPQSIVRKIENESPIMKNLVLGLITILIIGAGVGTGYLLSGSNNSDNNTLNSRNNVVSTKNEAGIADESKFSTTTDGILEEGGIGDEGTHHLVRGSGSSQYAYLTSSVVDLSSFVGKKVQVWGDTMSGKKAGWLIDVGKIKVIE